MLFIVINNPFIVQPTEEKLLLEQKVQYPPPTKKKMILKCTICNRFRLKKDLVEHYRSHNFCYNCNLQFDNEEKMACHFKNVHFYLQCDKCFFVGLSTTVITTHVLEKHVANMKLYPTVPITTRPIIKTEIDHKVTNFIKTELTEPETYLDSSPNPTIQSMIYKNY